jgi:pyridoxal phosphate enzyme (YggS family)
MVNAVVWNELQKEFASKGVQLIAVSKTKPAADIQALYDLGQRDFGENYVQELAEKRPQLPAGIRWHFIGHLQTNKVKYIVPFVHLIHTVDSLKLLTEISKQAAKEGRVVDVLLQLYVAAEETKFGLDTREVIALMDHLEAQPLEHVRICGLMGMATNTSDTAQVRKEFETVHNFFVFLKDTYFFARPWFNIISMGMSADYELAVNAGSNMVRIGSMLFGARS